MRRLQGKTIVTKPIPGNPGWNEFEHEGTKGKIRDDVLADSTQHSSLHDVPDLSRVKGTRQYREAHREAQP